MTTGEQELACEPKKLLRTCRAAFIASLEKMPDVIWAYNDGCTVEITCPPTEHDIFPHAEYLRSKPVKELLKEAKHLLDGMVNHQIYNSMICGQSNKLIAEIDKFLGDK